MLRIMMKSLVISAVFVLIVMAHRSAAGGPGARNLDCKDGRKPVGDLGIAAMSFKGSMSYNAETGEHKWYFQAEPKVREIDPEGPSAGKLQSGDVLVAIDGMAITTNKAGQRFGGIGPGETVSLSVRRKGRVIEAAIIPRAVCPEDHPMRIESFGLGKTRRELKEARRDLEATDLEFDRISEALESLSRLTEIEIPWPPEHPGRPEPPRRPEVRPRAWFGMRLACDGCTITRTKEDPTPKWRFDKPPRVSDVEPGGPADSAGVLEGDVLTHVDGNRIDREKGGQRFSSIEPGDAVTWTVRRDGEIRTVRMVASERPQEEVEILQHGERARLVDAYGPRVRLVRFSDTVAGADVEVRGDRSVKVIEDEETGEILILTCGAEIRVRAPSTTQADPAKPVKKLPAPAKKE